ncbi:hypothetical protein [Riemerella anatipestifer]|uniref:Lipoprotein n=3 Tax=Riemerella anatipestifer TaxID=34085 RepID=J9R1D5_RIEAN|nr:hypothetical protein [Riemerella anatipestifer]AFR36795.1 hypothetical protein B739_2213 [Riemerella anatipestifer RA-CH-1]MCO7331180.1 hypothetical protein [Riemerella anatipestifer]MCO7350349.1 hypothetical protein [Riemerella anatipestifer]MCU7583075.1 hypothetical protein [Riemerella anatipestifer]MCW0492067.1 hypothetical protein [Riemerella anatipestifer]
MKKTLFLSVLSLLTISCSDKLSESKVKSLVNECLEKDPIYGKGVIRSGKVSYMSEEDINQYQELQKKGLLTIESKEEKSGWFTNKFQLVALTDKSKSYVIESKDISENTKINYVKLYTNKLDKVGSIQEIPSMNIAEVSVTYKKEDKTPFYDVLEKDKTDFNMKKIALKKTENSGWIYCEK